MKSIRLNFSRPLHNSLFQGEDVQKLPEGSAGPGVYIWGFMIHERFIPYYVGKHQSSIAQRIQNHIADISKPGSTYMRLTRAYMEGLDGIDPFFEDENFPLITANWSKEKLPAWFDKSKDHFNPRISYLNNRSYLLLNGINVPNKQKDYPISLMNNADNYLKNNLDNLHVMYADCLHQYPEIKPSDYYELIEAVTKYHLRGRTVSKSLPFEKIEKIMISTGLDNIEVANVCDHRSIFKDNISMDFPGY